MQKYANLGGNSNIISYKVGSDYIVVEFMSGSDRIYTYTYASAGTEAIEQMKQLADSGVGLNSFIGRQRPGFSSKV
jgi:hypothetical protein